MITASLVVGQDSSPQLEVSNSEDAVFGDWGIEIGNLSESVSPGDDFFTYVNEKWLETTDLPPGYTVFTEFNAIFLRTERHIKEIILAPGNAAGPDSRQKLQDLYKSYVDVDAIEELGIEPLRVDLNRILAIDDHEGVARWMANPLSHAIVGSYIFADAGNPQRMVFHLDQQVLGGRIADWPEYEQHHAAYRDYIAAMFDRAGIDKPDLRADQIITLEKRLSDVGWTSTQLRDRNANYHPMRRSELGSYAPGFPWAAFLNEKGVSNIDYLVMNTDTAIQASARIFAQTPVDVWRSYLLFHWIQNHVDYLPASYRDASFEFYGQLLNGQKEPRDRDSGGIQFVSRKLSELVGALYVARHFPPSHREELREIVGYVRQAFRKRIDSAGWLDEETRKGALAKLATMSVQVGYPDKLRDYSEVVIKPDDLIGNVHRLRDAGHAISLTRINQPSQEFGWHLPPQMVDASYSPQLNRIIFPAGMMQPPAFDPNADPAVNFGVIGAVIAHEMGHGFDDQGSKFDATGRLHNWWTPTSRARFETATKGLVEQFNGYSEYGTSFRGKQTLGENLADLSGIGVAYHAYRDYLNDKHGGVAPVLDGFTGDQRFFMAWAQLYRMVGTEAGVRQFIRRSYHSLPKYRVNGAMRNIDAWYEAFGITEDDALYLPPNERVRLWQ